MNVVEVAGAVAQSLLVEIVSTAVAIPLITYFLLKFIESSKAARMWSVSSRVRQIFRGRTFPTIVMSTSSVHELSNGYKRPQTGIGQVRALALFAGSLSLAYRENIDENRVMFSQGCRVTQSEMSEDLIVIGGPKTNSIGRELLDLLSDQLPEGFSFAPIELEGAPEPTYGIRYKGETLQPANDDEVVGIVLRIANPRAEDRLLTYVAGLGTYGTEAAARALVECRELHRAVPFTRAWWRWRKDGKPRGYIAVVRAGLTGHWGDASPRGATNPRIDAITPIPNRAR
ncbi:hypothetical protein ACXR2T_14615 [Leucobacter sp. HY1910]